MTMVSVVAMMLEIDGVGDEDSDESGDAGSDIQSMVVTILDGDATGSLEMPMDEMGGKGLDVEK